MSFLCRCVDRFSILLCDKDVVTPFICEEIVVYNKNGYPLFVIRTASVNSVKTMVKSADMTKTDYINISNEDWVAIV